MTSLDVVKLLSGAKRFTYTVDEGGENWPIRYWGDTDKLAVLFKEWKLSFPDEKGSLLDYFKDLQTKPIKRKLRVEKSKGEIIWPV
jgi:hypothetical protein